MNAIVRITAKDLRHRWNLAVLTAVIVVFQDCLPFAGPSIKIPSHTGPIDVLLLLKWLLVLISTAVWFQDDSFTERQVFWRTRPIRPVELVAAKVLGVTIVVLLPALLALVVSAAPLGLNAGQWLSLIGKNTLRYLAVVSVVAAFASMAKTFFGALLGGCVGLVFSPLFGAGIAYAAGVTYDEEWTGALTFQVGGYAILGAGLLIMLQSVSSRTRLNRVVLYLLLGCASVNKTETHDFPHSSANWSRRAFKPYQGNAKISLKFPIAPFLANDWWYNPALTIVVPPVEYRRVAAGSEITTSDDTEWQQVIRSESQVEESDGHVDHLIPLPSAIWSGSYSDGAPVLRALGFRISPLPWHYRRRGENVFMGPQIPLFLTSISEPRAFRPRGVLTSKIFFEHYSYKVGFRVPLRAGTTARDYLHTIKLIEVSYPDHGDAEVIAEEKAVMPAWGNPNSWTGGNNPTYSRLALVNFPLREYCLITPDFNHIRDASDVLMRRRVRLQFGPIHDGTGTIVSRGDKYPNKEWAAGAELVRLDPESLGVSQEIVVFPNFILRAGASSNAPFIPQQADQTLQPATDLDDWN